MFPSKEFVPISVTTSIGNRQCKKHRECKLIRSFFTNIAQNLKYEIFKLRDLIWKKPPAVSTPTKGFNFGYAGRIFVE